MKPYCHMGETCIGCSPQLIEGVCPDSKAGTKGRMVPRDELLATLSKQLDDMFNSVERESLNECKVKNEYL